MLIWTCRSCGSRRHNWVSIAITRHCSLISWRKNILTLTLWPKAWSSHLPPQHCCRSSHHSRRESWGPGYLLYCRPNTCFWWHSLSVFYFSLLISLLPRHSAPRCLHRAGSFGSLHFHHSCSTSFHWPLLLKAHDLEDCFCCTGLNCSIQLWKLSWPLPNLLNPWCTPGMVNRTCSRSQPWNSPDRRWVWRSHTGSFRPGIAFGGKLQSHLDTHNSSECGLVEKAQSR